MIRKLSRAFIIASYVLAALIAQAAPALADPAVPTEYESRITSIEPTSDAVSLEVVGGDAFIEITVAPGHFVEILGYSGEPYIRIEPDGTVTVNDRSRSKYLNDDRYQATAVPDSANNDAPPRWQIVGVDGTYAWHDHRTHWMNPSQPPGLSGDVVQQVFAWDFPVFVDGNELLISGTLEWHPPTSAIAPLGIGLAIAAIAVLAWRRGSMRQLAVIVAVAAFSAVVLATTQWMATPSVARTFPTATVPPVFALVTLLAAAALASTKRVTAIQSIVVACVALMVFVFASFTVFTNPVLPSAMPDAIERVTTAAIGWLALAAGTFAVLEMLSLTNDSPGAARLTSQPFRVLWP